MNEVEKWDRVADSYQDVFLLGLNEYNASLLRFWKERGMLPPGARVLDIGCGVGKYGTYLAALGYEVTLTDISGEMLRRASENMAKYHTPWTVFRCDFNEANGNEPAFADGFDLVLSTMSPAIHNVDTVKKMSALSRGWCFLARFRAWEQPFRDKLMREMGVEPLCAVSDPEEDVAAMIGAVRAAGYTPQVKTVPYNWEDRRTPEQMAEYLCQRYFSQETDADSLRGRALEAARGMCGLEGCVSDAVRTKVAWIYWKTGEMK